MAGNFDTDSQLVMSFSITFFATSQNEADSVARNLINRVFGSSLAGLLKVVAATNVALVGQDVSGANYTYQYALDLRSGKSDNGTDPDVYNTIYASTAADALAALSAHAQRVTNITNFPTKIIYLKAAT